MIKNGGQLLLDQTAFFFDDEQLFVSAHVLPDPFRFQRPGHGHLEDRQPERLSRILVKTQQIKRMHHIRPGLAGGYDADAAAIDGKIVGGSVQPVGAHKCLGSRQLDPHQAFFLHQDGVGKPKMQPIIRQDEVRGPDQLQPVRADADGSRAFHGFGDALHPDPATGIAGHGQGGEAVVEIFLDIGGIKDRDACSDQRRFALVRHCR